MGGDERGKEGRQRGVFRWAEEETVGPRMGRRRLVRLKWSCYCVIRTTGSGAAGYAVCWSQGTLGCRWLLSVLPARKFGYY